MAAKTKGATPAGKAAAGGKDKKAPDEPQALVEVIVNGAVIGDFHHAKGKQMKVPLSLAETSEKLGHVKILGATE